MVNLFGEEYDNVPSRRKKQDPVIRSWEDGFQKWSNNVSSAEATHYGACGYGAICDYCKDNWYGRPCVRALNSMCREQFLSIDYNDKSIENYEKWFDGGR